MMDITIVCSDTGLTYKKEQHIDIQLGIPRSYRSNVAEKVIQVFREVFIEGVTSMDVSRYSWNAMKAWGSVFLLMFPQDSLRARAHLWSGRRPDRTSDGTIAELAPRVTRHANVRRTDTSIANYNETAFAGLIT